MSNCFYKICTCSPCGNQNNCVAPTLGNRKLHQHCVQETWHIRDVKVARSRMKVIDVFLLFTGHSCLAGIFFGSDINLLAWFAFLRNKGTSRMLGAACGAVLDADASDVFAPVFAWIILCCGLIFGFALVPVTSGSRSTTSSVSALSASASSK